MFLLSFSCNRQNHEQLKIDPRGWNESEIKLSDIADDISYLQMDNSYPFKATVMARPAITRNFIVIFIAGLPGESSTTGLVKYDRNGKLIGKIGNWGRGPEEYMSQRFACDDKTGDVYILNNGNRIKIYSKTGKYKKDIPIEKFGNVEGIELYNNKLFVFDFPGIGTSKFNWVVLDTLGNLIKTKENSLPPFANLYVSFRGSIYKFDNRLFYWNTYSDTVFSISPDLSTNADILFSQGPHRWPVSDFNPSESVDLSQIITNHLMPVYLFETNRFIVFYYFYKDKYTVAFIEKKTGEVRITAKNNPLNDIDGGIMFPLQYSRYIFEESSEYIAGFIDAYNLKAHVASESFKNSNPRYPEKKKALAELATRLKETDNPVLVMVRLKK